MPRQKVNTEKAINAILYVANRLGTPANVYHSLKAIYYADRAHLECCGNLIYGESYSAMPAGPVPSYAYDVVKFVGGRSSWVNAPGAAEAMSADTRNIFVKKDADLDLFSQADLVSLEKGIDFVRTKSFAQLKSVSHTPAYDRADPNGEMDVNEIVAELGDSQAIAAHMADRFPGAAK